jgi:hypothetical protein
MASATPVPGQITVVLSEGGAPLVQESLVRAFDWTLEEGAKESDPVIAGDFACTISAETTAPDLFDFCVQRPAVRFDEALFTVYSTVGSPLGSYRLQDCLITSFRFHDAGGAAGLAAGLASITLDWRHVDVSWGGLTRSYSKPKG